MSFQQCFAPVRNRNGYSPGCWWYLATRVRQRQLSTVPEMRGGVQKAEVKRMNSLFCPDTTAGDRTALSSGCVIASAITFLFLAINVLMLQN